VIPQLEQVLDASRLAYAAERGDATSIVESQRMVLDAQLAYCQALSDADVARADLERAIGASLAVVARLEKR
jgi:outer membrane protein TolC